MRRRAALLAAPLLALPLLAAPPAAAQAAPTVEVVPLVFTVTTGPEGAQECTVRGDLYVPSTATAASPAAAIMATNGFGGSKDDAGERGNATVARHYAQRGYVGLSYSGLGFGGSGCEITLDQREHDGVAGDALAQFLGGRKGIATRDGQPYDIGGIVRTEPGLAFDPVLGMIGVSYGGEVQFAVASFGRVDTIVPQITWNDLSYSLAPSSTGQLRTPRDPRSVSAPAGVSKIGWTSLFFALGLTQDVSNRRPQDLVSQLEQANACPNFDRRACTAILDLGGDGAPSQETIDFARSASVASYLDEIDVPVLLSQGQADTLFNLNEAIATWSALKARDVPVKMVWHSWGHSTSAPVPGELDQRRPASETFLGAMYAAWFDHHLLGKGPAPSLATEYFRDWAYAGDTRAAVAKAYASAPGYPVAPTQRLLLSGTDALVADPAAVQDGATRFASVVPAGAPQSYSEFPVVAQDGEPFDAPGTFAQFTSAPLEQDVDVAGVPAVTVRLSRTLPTVPLPDAAGGLVLFGKLYDLAPDGTVTLKHKLVAPVRITSFDAPVRIELPGVVQRFPAGHRMSLVLAASDSGHRGNVLPSDVTVTTSAAQPGVLELPVLGAARAAAPAAPAARPAPPAAPAPAAGALPATGVPALLPAAAALLLGAGLVARRRRTA